MLHTLLLQSVRTLCFDHVQFRYNRRFACVRNSFTYIDTHIFAFVYWMWCGGLLLPFLYIQFNKNRFACVYHAYGLVHNPSVSIVFIMHTEAFSFKCKRKKNAQMFITKYGQVITIKIDDGTLLKLLQPCRSIERSEFHACEYVYGIVIGNWQRKKAMRFDEASARIVAIGLLLNVSFQLIIGATIENIWKLSIFQWNYISNGFLLEWIVMNIWLHTITL